ncbi:PspC domain-containing protein [Streptomyces sp. NPDC048845]|uniref:PspC domain-containing protein n=1 Tax=Streptomyces sp. NPDC048845 TaxID=3155390 RepID=UPI00342837DC
MTDQPSAAEGTDPVQGAPGGRARADAPPAPGTPENTGATRATGVAGSTGAAGAAGATQATGAGGGAPVSAPGVGPLGAPPLRRSRRAHVISGVCGGLGRRFDLDPVIFRTVLAVLGVAGGVGLIAYGFAWLLIPLDGEDENELRRLLSGRVEGPGLTAVLFALVGSGLMLSMLNNGNVFFFATLLSAALAGASHWSLKRRAEQEGAEIDPVTAQAVAVAPPETTAPPTPGGPSWWRDPIVKDGTAGPVAPGPAGPYGPLDTGYLWGPEDGPDDAAAAGFRRRPPRQRRVWVGGWTFLAAVLAAVAGVGASWQAMPLGSSLQTGFACALAVFGLGLVVAAWYGRAGGGTVVAAVLTCALLVGAGAVPRSVTTQWAQREWRPAAAADLRDHYELGTGTAQLDLSGLKPERGQSLGTRASVGAGALEVVVPDDVRVRMEIEVGLGDVRLPGEPQDDIDVSPGRKRTVVLPPRDGAEPSGTLELELEAGVGQVEVRRAVR